MSEVQDRIQRAMDDLVEMLNGRTRRAERPDRPPKVLRELNEADKRAKELLLANLNPQQHEDYLRDLKFTVHGSAGGEYLMRIGSDFVYEVAKDGKILPAFFCLQSGCAWFPYYDSVLARKLLIENDERAFRREANRGLDWGYAGGIGRALEQGEIDGLPYQAARRAGRAVWLDDSARDVVWPSPSIDYIPAEITNMPLRVSWRLESDIDLPDPPEPNS